MKEAAHKKSRGQSDFVFPGAPKFDENRHRELERKMALEKKGSKVDDS